METHSPHETTSNNTARPEQEGPITTTPQQGMSRRHSSSSSQKNGRRQTPPLEQATKETLHSSWFPHSKQQPHRRSAGLVRRFRQNSVAGGSQSHSKSQTSSVSTTFTKRRRSIVDQQQERAVAGSRITLFSVLAVIVVLFSITMHRLISHNEQENFESQVRQSCGGGGCCGVYHFLFQDFPFVCTWFSRECTRLNHCVVLCPLSFCDCCCCLSRSVSKYVSLLVNL